MDPEDEIFVVEVEGMIQTLLLLIEAYKGRHYYSCKTSASLG